MISVSVNALKAHLAHGDTVGACGSEVTVQTGNNIASALAGLGTTTTALDLAHAITGPLDQIFANPSFENVLAGAVDPQFVANILAVRTAVVAIGPGSAAYNNLWNYG
jgi:hypothetical protein